VSVRSNQPTHTKKVEGAPQRAPLLFVGGVGRGACQADFLGAESIEPLHMQ
jgi:hypothetical protein